jgi:hypothetical protein
VGARQGEGKSHRARFLHAPSYEVVKNGVKASIMALARKNDKPKSWPLRHSSAGRAAALQDFFETVLHTLLECASGNHQLTLAVSDSSHQDRVIHFVSIR